MAPGKLNQMRRIWIRRKKHDCQSQDKGIRDSQHSLCPGCWASARRTPPRLTRSTMNIYKSYIVPWNWRVNPNSSRGPCGTSRDGNRLAGTRYDHIRTYASSNRWVEERPPRLAAFRSCVYIATVFFRNMRGCCIRIYFVCYIRFRKRERWTFYLCLPSSKNLIRCLGIAWRACWDGMGEIIDLGRPGGVMLEFLAVCSSWRYILGRNVAWIVSFWMKERAETRAGPAGARSPCPKTSASSSEKEVPTTTAYPKGLNMNHLILK